MRVPTIDNRLAVLAASGFANETELADAVLAFVNKIGGGLLEVGKLSESQISGVRGALNDTPIAFSALTGFPLPPEGRNLLLFMAAKLVDDMLSLGAIAMLAGNADIESRVLSGGSKGGNKSAEVRRKKQREWQDKVLELANAMRTKNGRLTQEDLVSGVRQKWKPDWPALPTDKSIKALFSKATKSGALRQKAR
jgi:hypothetical protein